MRTARTLGRPMLMLGCAGAALAASGRAGAQAFDANPTTQAGLVTYDRGTPGVETITVETPSAVIDWLPNSSNDPFVFLPFGNTATFTNGVNAADFVVLNRILTTRETRFDGTVLSQLHDFIQGTTGPGGTVIFQAPNGIIVGAKAIFDVGNLVLTTLPVSTDAVGNVFDGSGQIHFSAGDLFPKAAITVESGAKITALTQGSYVAMIAPRILQGGNVRVNGSIAYIAGEEVHMRVNQGLFDIIVDVGSDNATTILHTGTSGGPASTGANDVHAIYMVAMPKNIAITSILEGDVGFDPAVNAAIENGAIVLSAGYNVAGGAIDRFGDFTQPPVPGGSASFEIRGGTLRSDVTGAAVTSFLASGQTTGSLAFLGDVSLYGGKSAELFAGLGQTVSVAGDAAVSSDHLRGTDANVFNLSGGQARIYALAGGSLSIAGDATIDASAKGVVDQVNSVAGSGTGGPASLFADNGSVQIGGAVTITSTGQGATIDFAPDTGGNGTGGAVSVQALNGGSLQIGGGLNINASGSASRVSGNVQTVGGTGTGGNVSVVATGGGTIAVTGATGVTSNGSGGTVENGASNQGGLGQGGTIRVQGGGTITFTGNAGFVTNGTGGLGPNGGIGQGGNVFVDASLGQIAFNGDTNIDALATGGDANAFGGQGGNGNGGQVAITGHSGATPGRVTGAALAVNTAGTGGRGGGALIGTPAGRGGDGHGGTITIVAESANGNVQFGALTAGADGLGGTGGFADFDNGGGRGGDGTGGSVQAGTVAGPAGGSPVGSARFASADLHASGTGGTGGNGSGAGGTGNGGTAGLTATLAPTQITGATLLTANATGGAGGANIAAGGPDGALGQADGGQVILAANGATGAISAGTVTGTANATGLGNSANSPGEWHVRVNNGGTITLANLTLTAQANGTPAVRPFSSIEAANGLITISQTGTLTTQGEIRGIFAGTGRVTGGRLNLAAGDDVTLSHANPAANAISIDVANLFVTAGDDFTAGVGVVTRASAQTDIRAVDLTTVAGRLIGRDIFLGSADIAIADTGAIGDAATETVTLGVAAASTPAPNQTTIIGGTAQGPGYTLDNLEAGRIRANTLRILAPALAAAANRPPDLILRDLSLAGGGAAAGIGTLDIVTPGIARVEGNVLIANARAQDGLSIAAATRLEVVTPTASLRVHDNAGNPGGTMSLASANIWVASAAIIDQLRLDPNYATRDDDLLDNDGVEAPLGYVEANAVTLATGATLYVQNSTSATGTLATGSDFGGITVGPGGLTIRSTANPAAGGGPASVTAFGRRRNADGSFTTGDAFFHAASYLTNGVPLDQGYTAGSTLNTCIIVTGACAIKTPLNPLPGPDPILGPVFGPNRAGGSVAILLSGGAGGDDLVDTSFASDPLIEEPVTSGSETSLWDCPDENHDGQCDAPHE